jgi:hypothetical protein
MNFSVLGTTISSTAGTKGSSSSWKMWLRTGRGFFSDSMRANIDTTGVYSYPNLVAKRPVNMDALDGAHVAWAEYALVSAKPFRKMESMFGVETP